jgi:hypothetical protein
MQYAVLEHNRNDSVVFTLQERRVGQVSRENKLRVGDWVKVRSKQEILGTLDRDGCIEGMPFMPEMFRFCDQKLQVYKVAHKTCDYGRSPFTTRRLKRTVHLATRCDGSAHGGCQAGCLLFWKEDWLEKISGGQARGGGNGQKQTSRNPALTSACSEDDVWKNVQLPHSGDGSPTYVCQMTQVHAATEPLAWGDPRQYITDYRSGNVSFSRILAGFIYWVYYSISQAGIGVGRPMRWFYDLLSPLWGGPLFPRKVGTIPAGEPTPLIKLNLQPGEWVRVKSHLEILKTVDADNKNRGMHWDAELVPYCGGEYRVLDRVTRIIGEQTGKIQEMKSPCIILESVVCQARYSSCRLFCPKSMYPFWREAWLERIEPQPKCSAPDAAVTDLSEAQAAGAGESRPGLIA